MKIDNVCLQVELSLLLKNHNFAATWAERTAILI